MSLVLHPMTGVVWSMVSFAVTDAAGVGDGLQITIAACTSIAGIVFHMYSPLPATNGGFGAPPAYLQQWGFTDDPLYDDYEEPTTGDVVSAAVPFGFSFRKRTNGDDE